MGENNIAATLERIRANMCPHCKGAGYSSQSCCREHYQKVSGETDLPEKTVISTPNFTCCQCMGTGRIQVYMTRQRFPSI
jgi:RecJ-like exonuclease